MLTKAKHRGSTILLLWCLIATGAAAGMWQASPAGKLDVTVTDQNGQPLASAVVTLQQNGKTVSEHTTPTGHILLDRLPAGSYKLSVRREGFYTALVDKVEVPAGATVPVEVRLEPVREYREEVEVRAQSSPIDPEQVSTAQSLTVEDIATIPYPTTRDYRNVLPFIPGVIADNGGQIHVAGSSTQQVQDYLDGFEVSQPASGALGVRMNPDALRKIAVRSSRYSAQFGKGSGGLTDLELQDGDNKFRFNATDFIPTFQNVKGFHLNNWTPRAYFSGPLIKDKLWFDVSHEGENDLSIVKELPDGADSTRQWRTADMARLRLNLTPGNVVTASALVNVFNASDAGITPFDPVSVSTNQHSRLDLFTVKDQITIAGNTLLEFGVGQHDTKSLVLPQGFEDYLLTPTGRQGNYYLHSDTGSARSQAFGNLYLRPWTFLGKHQFTVGGRVDRVLFNGQATRNPLLFQDINGALLRTITFTNVPHFSLSTVESSAFVQDRWTGFDRVTVESGVRWDHDSFVDRDVFSPRIAGSAMLDAASETKLSAGVGIYYDRANLFEVGQAAQGTRVDEFLSPVPAIIPGTFIADPGLLTLPRFVNWSVGLERRLPGRVYARVNFLSRHGTNVWAYEPQTNGTFLLGHQKTDRYDGAEITVRKEFKRGYPMLVSYTRSNARSNESIDFGIDNFTSGTQAGGPLPWDAPNQVTSWGSTPLPSLWKFKKFDFAYSLLYRTGFPFATVNNFGQIVNPPGVFRLPHFFTLNPAIEKKFTFHGYRWAARVGIENVTNSANAPAVDNDVDSPTFGTLFGQAHRTFNGRIRLLGKQ
ncbi:MAG TPA: carboxypeptidase regulatory-like domain-containing protein [Candidatus Angelobacter sp.]|nr:carboxypeptidase regulatory-like domain-containing protein [Candidatus Angelobacter sp.]